jgi:hypothetical protein
LPPFWAFTGRDAKKIEKSIKINEARARSLFVFSPPLTTQNEILAN